MRGPTDKPAIASLGRYTFTPTAPTGRLTKPSVGIVPFLLPEQAMSKQQLIEAIRRHNPTADASFLTDFDSDALTHYLHHLRHMARPRGVHSYWVRRAETAAVVTRAV